MKPEGYTNVCEQCAAKPLDGVCDCPESLNAEIKRLKAINAELLAACELSLAKFKFDDIKTHVVTELEAAIANAQPQGE